MKALIRKLLETTALLAAVALSPAVHGGVFHTVDFNPPALVNLYFPGDSFTQAGMRMTVDFDFGIVDVAAALGPLAPSGNATQFYFNSNNGGLIVEAEDGLPFSLLGFDAAFVPLSPPSPVTTVMVAFATDVNNDQFGVAWLFAPPVNGAYPFFTYNDPADFASFVNLRQVEFFACTFVGGQVCTFDPQNNGQFAIDNIQVRVPEPASAALVTIAMLALGVSLRRKAV